MTMAPYICCLMRHNEYSQDYFIRETKLISSKNIWIKFKLCKMSLSKERVTENSMFISQKAKKQQCVCVCGQQLSPVVYRVTQQHWCRGLLVKLEPRIDKRRLFTASRLQIHEFFRNIESFDPIKVSLQL